MKRSPKVRKFSTGATRDSDIGKHDYEGFLSPSVLESYGKYMTKHRVQTDGTIRDSDNWQKGMPLDQYMKSLVRHVFQAWHIHRDGIARDPVTGKPIDIKDSLSAIMFNVMGYLHEYLKQQRKKS